MSPIADVRATVRRIALLHHLCFVTAAWIAATGCATAQIEANDAVVSRFQSASAGSQLGGLWVLDLDAPLSSTPIVGLGAELTGSTSGIAVEGAASVLVDRRTGNLIVGEHALPGDSTDIHVLTLAGNTVVLDQKYPVAVAPGGGGWVDQMAWLGDDIVFTNRGGNITTGPFANQVLGILRPRLGPPGAPGTVVPVPVVSFPLPGQNGNINALAVDELGGIAYVGLFNSNIGLGQIYAIPVPGDGVTPAVATLVASVPAGILNMAFDGDGTLLVGCLQGAGSLFRVDVTQTPATITPIPNGLTGINGMAIENATGDYLLTGSGVVLRRLANGTTFTLDTRSGSGIAIRQQMIEYGAATPGQNDYGWQLAPNPSGLPGVGNTGFALSVTSSPGTALGVVGFSLGEANLPALGLALLLDPATLILPSVLPSAAQSSVPLPIPADPNLVDAQLFAQVFFLEPGMFTATRGLQVTITP